MVNIQSSNNLINNKNYQNRYQNNSKSFKGIANAITTGLQTFDKYPMIGVSFVDTVSTNIPRTVVDLKTTGIPAAAETARREFSGLFVNCLMPSFIVLGVAKLLNSDFIKKFPGTNMANSWANQETIEKFTNIYKGVKGNSVQKSRQFAGKVLSGLEGLDGETWVDFADKFKSPKVREAAKLLGDTIANVGMNKKQTSEAIAKVHKMLTEETNASSIIRFKGDAKTFGSNLSELLRDQVNIGRQYLNKSVTNNLDGFKEKAAKFINKKSLIGMAIIIPVAMSVQAINRKMTRKKYNAKGAPIYKDFGKKNTHKEMTPAQKTKFMGKKILSAGSIFGLAVLSMMKKPSLKMFQFKGMFPTVDQCRWIASSTFASRMFAAEDENELRESTVRDIASFSGLYFLGDYAAKATASAIEKAKPDVKLLNREKVLPKDAPILKKFGNWVKNVQLKSFDEVKGPNAKNLRSACQIASLAFSIITLGVLLPMYNRKVTERKVAEAQKAENLKNQNSTHNFHNLPNAFKGIAKLN